jgi:hypothetical protein
MKTALAVVIVYGAFLAAFIGGTHTMQLPRPLDPHSLSLTRR